MKIKDIINTDSFNDNEGVITIINYLARHSEIKELDSEGIELDDYFKGELKNLLHLCGFDNNNKYYITLINMDVGI